MDNYTTPRQPEANANAEFAYDKLGRLTLAGNSQSKVQFAYDPPGNLLQETQAIQTSR